MRSDARSPTRDVRRRLERVAANPACAANRLAVVHDLPMERAAREIFHLEPSVGQSPFAIARGVIFERALFADGARVFLEELKRSSALPESAAGFADLRLQPGGGPMRDLDTAAARFVDLLQRFEANAREIPALIAGAPIELPGRPLLPDGMLVLDALTVQVEGDRTRLRVGEIKAYPDRGGHTDRGSLASARAQAGLYLHALRLFVGEIGLRRVEVADDGFLVLLRAESNRPSVRTGEDLRHQARRVERAYDMLRAAADQERAHARAPALCVLASAEKSYCEACISFCELADYCGDEAVRTGAAVSLGTDARRLLGTVSIGRALALAAGATPSNEVERDLVRRIDELGGLR
jgi:hypothetical protein